ncbi:hypothetical protein F4677DRAFT_429163 [Hypoxylon crocopeplum]|nr:hypothetical protein F4677DRAFT_429163 [Hypoxylon crocopeplum]
MAEPSVSRDHGPGDETRRHSRHKRTRGEDDLHDVKRVRPRYRDDDRTNTSKRFDEPRRRSLSADREGRHGSRQDEYRRRDEHTRGGDHVSRTTRKDERHSTAGGLDSRSDNRATERSPSTSSMMRRHHHHHHHHHHRHRRTSNSTRTPDKQLPLGARPLVRSDLEAFRPLLAQYLEVQKQKDITTIDEREVRGRWKSFVHKWNHSELAEGWYRPETLAEASDTYANTMYRERGPSTLSPVPAASGRPIEEGDHSARSEEDDGDGDDDDDGYGPTLPPGSNRDPSSEATRSAKHGPGIPNRQDLDLRRENMEDERQHSVEQLRLARKADRAEQKARLEDLAPRAEPGTRERQLEKKREAGDKMRAFRDKSPGAPEVGEAELIGGGEDEVAEYKRTKAAADRRRSEREVRKEEEARAKAAEREDRVREYRRREEDTMDVLRRIARERFG